MTSSFQFEITARIDPQTIGRMVGFISQLGLIPRTVHAETGDETMALTIRVDDIAEQQAGIVAEKMRNAVLVEDVVLRCGGEALAPLSESFALCY